MRSYLLIYLIFGVSLFGGSVTYGKEPSKRFALFIANQNYENRSSGFEPLKNPFNDVKGVAKALQKAGFTSFIYNDLTSKDEMERAVDAFILLLKEEDKQDDAVVWFYYAGHGVQGEDGKSYLVPTGAAIRSNSNSDKEFDENTMSAQYKLYDKGERKDEGISIFVLDTCRNSSQGKFTSLKSDLVSVGGGTVTVVFSTKANEVSKDGVTLSPFAENLIDGINRYHWQPLEDVLQEVGKEVRKDTSDQQQVYVYGWVGKKFCLSQCLDTQTITITP